MENENKEKVILTDVELKEVTGGKEVISKHALSNLRRNCERYRGGANIVYKCLMDYVHG